MLIEEALAIVDTALQPKRLNDVEELLLRQCWLGKSYYEIAEDFDYDPGYLRVVGSRLWKELGDALGEKITKNNIRSILRQKKETIDEQIDKRATVPEPSFTEQAEFPGNRIRPDSPFYVERPPIESRCCSEILQPGALIRIKAPKKMGKSSLLFYILNYANHQGYRGIRLNFLQADREALENLNNLLRWFCKSITWKLKFEQNLDSYWDNDAGLAKYSCTRYFEEYLLEQLDYPLVLALDGLDRLFAYPEVAQDFLPLLRVWHEESKESETWEKLRLVIAHSTEFYLSLNVHQSPFNVGVPIVLPEWNSEQVRNLARHYGLNWSDAETEQLMTMVGGYPYLVQLALYHLVTPSLVQQKNRENLEQVLQNALTETSIYINHLRYLENAIAAPELLDAMKQVTSSDRSVLLNSVVAYQLESIGLVKFYGNQVVISCELYYQYFRDRL